MQDDEPVDFRHEITLHLTHFLPDSFNIRPDIGNFRAKVGSDVLYLRAKVGSDVLYLRAKVGSNLSELLIYACREAIHGLQDV